jgi:hypothetical protein
MAASQAAAAVTLAAIALPAAYVGAGAAAISFARQTLGGRSSRDIPASVRYSARCSHTAGVVLAHGQPAKRFVDIEIALRWGSE